jgi:hypothetical protein
MAWRRRVADALQTATSRRERDALARELGIDPSKVSHWANPSLADGSVLPAFALVFLPRSARAEMLHLIEQWGERLDRGDA